MMYFTKKGHPDIKAIKFTWSTAGDFLYDSVGLHDSAKLLPMKKQR
jgi:hypothetical protein